MVMTRAQFVRDLQDGINAHFGLEYNEHQEEWSQIFEKRTSKRAFEEIVQRIGLGEAVEKAEGGVIQFDAGAEGWTSRVTFSTYALAFAITEEAIDDNLYADLSAVYGPELAKALQNAVEVRCARMLNKSFDANHKGGDGKSLCAPDHPLWGGGAMSNKLATASDLSEEAMEDAIIQASGFVNDRGRPIVVKIKQMIIPRQQIFRADRLLKTDGRVGTANNDINAIKKGKYIPGDYVVNHYLLDPDAWWLQTDVKQGLTFWERKGIKRGMEKDFQTGNLQYKAQRRFGTSWGDPRCLLGSDGSPV